MITKFKTFLVAGSMIASLPLLSTANNGQDKETLCHNGHEITIAKPAVQHHLDNHNRDGAKLTCYRGPCGTNTPPAPKPPKQQKPPTGCTTCPPCTGCQ